MKDLLNYLVRVEGTLQYRGHYGPVQPTDGWFVTLPDKREEQIVPTEEQKRFCDWIRDGYVTFKVGKEVEGKYRFSFEQQQYCSFLIDTTECPIDTVEDMYFAPAMCALQRSSEKNIVASLRQEGYDITLQQLTGAIDGLCATCGRIT